MDLQVIGGGSVSVSDEAFGRDYNQSLVHQAVTAYMAGGRAGTKAQKNRSDVSGGGAKPWRQKGTGRARAGTIRSPLWRSGGATFAARPRDFTQKLNKKMYRAAIRSIISELARQDRLVVVDAFAVDSHKTKDLVAKLKELDLSDVFIVTDEVSDDLAKASGNLYRVDIAGVSGINPVSLLRNEKVLMTSAAVKKIEGWLS